MILDGELVAFDAERQAVVRRNAGPRAIEDRARDRRGGRGHAGRVRVLRPPLLRRHRPAPGAYEDRRRYLAQCLLPSPLVQLVHVADDGIALHDAAVASGFEGVVGKRKASRYESGRRSGSWLKVKPTQTADFVIGGYTEGKGVARAFGGGAGRLLGRRQAALRIARRLGLRQQVARAGQGAPVAARAKDAAVRGRARAQCAHDLGEACRRGRGELPELDRRRPPARARVPAPARRHRSASEVRRPQAARLRRRRRAPSTTWSRSSIEQERVHARGRRASHSPHQPRSRVLAGGPGAQAPGDDQARPPGVSRAESRLTCCRILPIARSP